jgi:hypothetical protein
VRYYGVGRGGCRGWRVEEEMQKFITNCHVNHVCIFDVNFSETTSHILVFICIYVHMCTCMSVHVYIHTIPASPQLQEAS